MSLNMALRKSTAEMLNPLLQSTLRQLEKVQSRPIKIIKGIRNLTYTKRLRKPKGFHLAKQKLRDESGSINL